MISTREMTDEEYDAWSDSRGDNRETRGGVEWRICGSCGGDGCPTCDYVGEVLVEVEDTDDDQSEDA